ncbi:MAG TPA: PH domain-containing protein [Opitutaceae bacterium]|nr:PH domain-containing protein [Opitutaceae bacterium]
MTQEETLVWKGTPSQWTNFGTYFFCLLLAGGVVAAYFYFTPRQPLIFAGLALPALWAFSRWVQTRCQVYEITSERIRTKTGLLSRVSTELELYRVRDYTVEEPFFLRLIGRGNLILQTSDRSNPRLVLHAVPGANALKDQIRTHTERMRQLRGVRDLDIDPT